MNQTLLFGVRLRLGYEPKLLFCLSDFKVNFQCSLCFCHIDKSPVSYCFCHIDKFPVSQEFLSFPISPYFSVWSSQCLRRELSQALHIFLVSCVLFHGCTVGLF